MAATTVDLSGYKGQNVTVYFNAYNDGVGGRTAMYLDNICLQFCDPTLATTQQQPSPTPSLIARQSAQTTLACQPTPGPASQQPTPTLWWPETVRILSTPQPVAIAPILATTTSSIWDMLAQWTALEWLLLLLAVLLVLSVIIALISMVIRHLALP